MDLRKGRRDWLDDQGIVPVEFSRGCGL